MAWALVALVAAPMPGAGLSARATAADGEATELVGPDWPLRFQLQLMLPSFK